MSFSYSRVTKTELSNLICFPNQAFGNPRPKLKFIDASPLSKSASLYIFKSSATPVHPSWFLWEQGSPGFFPVHPSHAGRTQIKTENPCPDPIYPFIYSKHVSQLISFRRVWRGKIPYGARVDFTGVFFCFLEIIPLRAKKKENVSNIQFYFPPKFNGTISSFLKWNEQNVVGVGVQLCTFRLSLVIDSSIFGNPFPRIGSNFNRGNTTTPACGILIRQSEGDPSKVLGLEFSGEFRGPVRNFLSSGVGEMGLDCARCYGRQDDSD